MFEQHAFPMPSVTRLEAGTKERFGVQQRTPAQNLLLAALPAKDYERLLPDLEPFPLPLGWTVHESGGQETYLYFLTAGIVCRSHVTETGASTGFAVTGREGVIGVASFLGGGSSPSQAKVLSAGYAFRLRASVLKNEFIHDGPLPKLLLRYTQSLFTQIGQVAACNRHHSLEQRLCRWLLSCLDRLPSNALTVTQKRFADMLGARREGVTAATGRLQRAGIVHCRRGQIAVLDRSGLEARACECYAVVRRDLLLDEYRCAEDAAWRRAITMPVRDRTPFSHADSRTKTAPRALLRPGPA